MDSKKDIVSRSDDSFAVSYAAKSNLAAFNFRTDAVRKAERLIAAIYLVTDFVPYGEPLRERLRTCGIMLVTDLVGPLHYQALSRMQEMLSLIMVARQISFISDMNAELLQKELYKLIEMTGQAPSDSVSVSLDERV